MDRVAVVAAPAENKEGKEKRRGNWDEEGSRELLCPQQKQNIDKGLEGTGGAEKVLEEEKRWTTAMAAGSF
jgi:hypothetical protein